MQFLKTLFWVVVAVAIVLFAANNWTLVSVRLFGGLRLDTKLPVLVIGAFLLGFVPVYAVYRTQLWRWRRRVLMLEGQVTPPAASADPASMSSAPPAASVAGETPASDL